MSRIYEALQKAEAERGGNAGVLRESRDGHSVATEAVPGGNTGSRGTRDQEGDAAIRRRYSALVDEPEATFRAPVPGTSASGEAWDEVSPTVWTPAFDRLPSLLDRGPAVEQFRSLRSRLYELRDKRPLKTVLVTSGLPQEGKSFIASNLAISLGRNRNARVLLIDGDMRRYTVHKMMGCKSNPGLADYLAGRSRLEDVMQRVDAGRSTGMVQGTVVRLPDLTVIPGGNGGDNAADLSNGHRWGELLDAVSPHFDWIVVDSSPVLPVSDTVNLSRSCDGVLLVARNGVTVYENLQRTQAELKSATLLGVVLNAAETPKGKTGYYGYNSYHSYAPHDASDATRVEAEQGR